MKKKVFAASVFLLCLAILAGTTMAYFTARDTAHNVITTGNVNIQVVEKQDVDGTLVDYPRAPISGVLPGESVSKIVSVRNTGSGDAWIRVRISKAIDLNPDYADRGQEADPALIELNVDTEHWQEKDGWYYYKDVLDMGRSTEPLFETVTFSSKMNNAYQDCEAGITIEAQAVQSKNNPKPSSGDFSEIPGWPTK